MPGLLLPPLLLLLLLPWHRAGHLYHGAVARRAVDHEPLPLPLLLLRRLLRLLLLRLVQLVGK